ncbi:DUF4172 domain-containing protein [Spongiibacter nanhainus]|uniref:DUF4172 domain-containing protein n=1 Tax=Spongiibacter nanhainus TaxID=2794344 RepID=A0A7T4R3Y1_9GAMM|nr:DUF4172 domain-containing protein [Spongiibacter nanhainus]
MGFELQQEAELYTLTEDVLRTSEIEGEILDKQQVRSPIARYLGMDIPPLVKADHAVESVVKMIPEPPSTSISLLPVSACVPGMQRCFPLDVAACTKSPSVTGIRPKAALFKSYPVQ